jgi:hypothetical protein
MYTNQIRVPQKSKRQMQFDMEEANRFRVLRQYYDVNERIHTAIENANQCMKLC